MSERNQRIFIFLGALIAALLVILVVTMVTSGDGDSVAEDSSSTTEATTAVIDETTTTEAGTTTTEEATTTTEAATTTSTSTSTTTSTTSTTTTTTTAPPPPPGPEEVSRITFTLESGDLRGTGTTPLFMVSLPGAGFATSHDWWLESTTMPGAEGCRDSSGGAVANPVSLTPLSISTGWYGCSAMSGDVVVQLHIIDVQIGPDRVIVELVVWDFTP